MTEIRNEVLNMIVENNLIYSPTYEQLMHLKSKYGVLTTDVINTFNYFKYSEQGKSRIVKAFTCMGGDN